MINTRFKFYSKKDRRNSGRRFYKIVKPTMKYSEIIEHALEPSAYWDDWTDYRDGWRDLTHMGSCGNKCDVCKAKEERIKKKLAIRKAKKQKQERMGYG